MKNKKNSGIILPIVVVFIILMIGAYTQKDKLITDPNKRLKILSGSENKELEEILRDFENEEGIKVEMVYQGSVDSMNEIKRGADEYDAVWPANSI